MRPTDLGFRSPKERTPDAYAPQVTNQGKSLGFSNKSHHSSFSTGKRFQQYEIDAKRTGHRLGPGCYQSARFEISNAKKGGPVYKAFHGGKDMSNNGYYYIGNQLVFDPAFVLKSRRSSLVNADSYVEYSKNPHSIRPESAKTRESKSNYSTTPSRKRPGSARPSAKSPYHANFMT